MRISGSTYKFLLLLLAEAATIASAMKEKATGVTFADKKSGLEIFGVGVRRKGPIKAYAVAMYASSGLKEKLAAFSRKKEEKQALSALRDSAGKDSDAAFCLQMTFKVGAEKFSSAIAESVAPRFRGPSKEIEELKDLVFGGVEAKGGAVKGLKLDFQCSGSGVHVAVDGKDQGTVKSGSLAKAFCDVYLDDKCVSPSLRKSILDECCSKE